MGSDRPRPRLAVNGYRKLITSRDSETRVCVSFFAFLGYTRNGERREGMVAVVAEWASLGKGCKRSGKGSVYLQNQ